MPGMRDFTTLTFAPRVVVTKAANYTVLLSDELVQTNGAYTMTLPVISSMQGTIQHKKTYQFKNVHATATATITAGTGNTIGGRASYSLKPNENIIISASEAATDWIITSPYPTPAFLRVPFSKVVDTSGTDAVNVFDANGAPTNIDIDYLSLCAQDTASGNISLFNVSDTCATVAKSTTAGVVTGSYGTISYAAVASGSAITVKSDGGNARVIIFGTQQVYA